MPLCVLREQNGGMADGTFKLATRNPSLVDTPPKGVAVMCADNALPLLTKQMGLRGDRPWPKVT